MLTGIFPVIPTLFTDDDNIAPAAMRSVIQFALNSGANGIVFPGVASEYNFLSPDERGELLAVVCDEVAGKVPVIGGASAATSSEVIAAAQQAISHGIDHLMVMAPASLGKDLKAQSQFFSEVTRRLPGVRIVLQNAPSPVGAGLDTNEMIQLVGRHESIAFAKEETLPSGPTITALQRAAIGHLQGVFGGGGARYIIDELRRGAIGAFPAVELTDIHVALFRAMHSGDEATARQLYTDTLPLLVAQMIYRMRLTKYVLHRRGITDHQHVRAPLPELDELARYDIDQLLTEALRSQTAE